MTSRVYGEPYIYLLDRSKRERDVKDFILSRFHKYYILCTSELVYETSARLIEALISIVKHVVAFSKNANVYSSLSIFDP